MGADAVGDLAGDLAHVRVDRGELDRDLGMLDRRRREQRHHQAELVMLAPEIELGPVLPALPDRPQRADIFAHPRAGRRPLHAVAALDMAFDLGAEAQREASLRQPLQGPGGERGHRRAARKGDRHRGREPDPLGRLRRQRHHDIGVVLGLLGDDPVIAERLGEPRLVADPGEVEPRRRRPQSRIERAERELGLDFHGCLTQIWPRCGRRARAGSAPRRLRGGRGGCGCSTPSRRDAPTGCRARRIPAGRARR